MDVALEFLDPDVEFHEDPRFPESGAPYRGRDAVRGYFDQFMSSFDELIFEPEEFIDAGDDRVLVLFHLVTRGKGSGARTEARPGWIYTVRDRKAVRIDSFLDREDALAAAHLPGGERSES